MTYDLFTSTHTDNHFNVSQKIFLALKQNGFLYTDQRAAVVCAQRRSASCPTATWKAPATSAAYRSARSDQCDKCGNLLDPTLLINPRSKIDGSTPELRETEHYYLDLGKLQDAGGGFPRACAKPTGARTCCASRWARSRPTGCTAAPITRDLDWGIPVPLEGWDGKCLYVWFEAVIGYLSASIEWARLTGQPGRLAATGGTTPDARSLLFHRQGQHPLPRHHLAGPADRQRRRSSTS